MGWSPHVPLPCYPHPTSSASRGPHSSPLMHLPLWQTVLHLLSHPVQKLRGVLYWILHCTQLKLSVRLTQYSEVNRKAKYKQGIAIALRTGCFQSSEVLAHGIEQALSSGGGVYGRLTFVTGNWVLVHCGVFLWMEKRD